MIENNQSLTQYYLNELKKFNNYDFDIHKDNLIKKLQNTLSNDKTASFKQLEDIKIFIDPYIQYRQNIDLLLNQINENNILFIQEKMVSELQTYKEIVFNLNNLKSGNSSGQYFSSQSKYEPTILE